MSKLPHVGTTIFTVMSQLANESGAINLSQGFPNFPVDPALIKIVQETASSDAHQYRPMPGSPKLKEACAGIVERQYQRTLDPDQEVLVVAGATQGLFTAIMALVNHGDEVVVLDPSYDSYDPSIRLSGGKPVHVSLNKDFLPDWDRINNVISEKTRMIITNNPHNPSGRVWNESDMAALEALMAKHPNLILLSDEVYEFITFEKKHLSAHLYPSLYDRCITVSSFGKTFHITGWKMGYVTAPKSLMVEIKKVHQFNVFSVNSVAQVALEQYIPTVDLNAVGGVYDGNRRLFPDLIKDSKFELLPCDGP